MSVLIRAIECFVEAAFWGLLPFGIGFALGRITKGDNDGLQEVRKENQDDKSDKEQSTDNAV